MVKYRKIRGHNRIQKDIETWRDNNLKLDLDYLQSRHRDYCKIWVSPFCDISVLNSKIPSPSGKNRTLIIESLLAIFNSWEAQLKSLNKPYYLAIWLFEPNLENSQVVCAIDSMLDFYNVTFFRPKDQRKMPTQNYGKFKDEISQFNWTYALEEHYFTKDEINYGVDEYASIEDYNYFKRYYRKKIKNGARPYKNKDGSMTYFEKIGKVWIGTKN